MLELFPETDDKNKVLEELNCSSRYSQTRIEKKMFLVKFRATHFQKREFPRGQLRGENEKIGNLRAS